MLLHSVADKIIQVADGSRGNVQAGSRPALAATNAVSAPAPTEAQELSAVKDAVEVLESNEKEKNEAKVTKKEKKKRKRDVSEATDTQGEVKKKKKRDRTEQREEGSSKEKVEKRRAAESSVIDNSEVSIYLGRNYNSDL